MEGLTIAWWMWFVLGIVMLLSEFFTPGAFFQFFFGIGGVALGLLGAFGMEVSLPVQLLLFLTFSLGSLALLRRPLRMRFNEGPGEDVDQMVGGTAIALGEIKVNEVGQAELRGTVWSVRNVGDQPVARSQRCRVVRVDGLTLEIRG